MTLRRPEDHGHWDGMTFVFEPPARVPTDDGEITMREFDTSTMTLPNGVTRDDVIRALLNPTRPNEFFIDQAP